MIYILKFIAAFLLPPGLFVLLGVILSTYLWRKRQHFGRFAFSLSAVLTLLLYFSSTLLGAPSCWGSRWRTVTASSSLLLRRL